MKEKVIRIEEADYGCEELPEGQETQVRVILEDENGRQRVLLTADRRLYEEDIQEGDVVSETGDGSLRKA